jgi:hypothetical protein
MANPFSVIQLPAIRDSDSESRRAAQLGALVHRAVARGTIAQGFRERQTPRRVAWGVDCRRLRPAGYFQRCQYDADAATATVPVAAINVTLQGSNSED